MFVSNWFLLKLRIKCLMINRVNLNGVEIGKIVVSSNVLLVRL